MKKRALLALASLATGAVLSASTATAGDGYLRPVVANGYAFPVARSNWYSVINFRNDWHAPRMRFVNDKWVQVGVHEGNDVFAEPGTPIMSMFGGHIEQLGWTFYSGWRVGVRGDDGRYWFYAHMRRFATGLSIGDRVEAGTILGEVGNTGYGSDLGHDNEFTYHLHLGIQEPDGTWVNPYRLLRSTYAEAVRAG